VRKAQADAFAVVKGQVEEDIRRLVGRASRKGKAEAPVAAAAAPAVAKEPPINPEKLKLSDTIALPDPVPNAKK